MSLLDTEIKGLLGKKIVYQSAKPLDSDYYLAHELINKLKTVFVRVKKIKNKNSLILAVHKEFIFSIIDTSTENKNKENPIDELRASFVSTSDYFMSLKEVHNEMSIDDFLRFCIDGLFRQYDITFNLKLNYKIGWISANIGKIGFTCSNSLLRPVLNYKKGKDSIEEKQDEKIEEEGTYSLQTIRLSFNEERLEKHISHHIFAEFNAQYVRESIEKSLKAFLEYEVGRLSEEVNIECMLLGSLKPTCINDEKSIFIGGTEFIECQEVENMWFRLHIENNVILKIIQEAFLSNGFKTFHNGMNVNRRRREDIHRMSKIVTSCHSNI